MCRSPASQDRWNIWEGEELFYGKTGRPPCETAYDAVACEGAYPQWVLRDYSQNKKEEKEDEGALHN